MMALAQEARATSSPLPLAETALPVSVTWPPPSLGNKGFTGREWDPETGFYYYRARYYDAKIGRFISEDPIGLLGGDVNFFAYVWNRPVNLVDPNGLWGFGAQGGGQLEGGIAAAGLGGQAGIGGVFTFENGFSGANAGGFVQGGGILSLFGGGTGFPPGLQGIGNGPVGILGATAGAGVGFFGTNATSPCDLTGPFNTFTISTPLISFGWQTGTNGAGNSIKVGSVGVGKSWGIAVSRYQTTTKVFTSTCSCK